MDKMSTVTPEHSGFEGQASVSSFLTSIVLLLGVSGGLFIVITVILICKYCHAKEKNIKRNSSRESGIQHLSGRTYCALQRYETINSDVFSDSCSCSVDGASVNHRKTLDFRISELGLEQQPTETTRLKNDYEEADYTRQEGKSPTEPYMESDVVFGDQENMPSSTQTGNTTVTGSGSRCLEGDHHHPKHTSTGRPLPRQFTIGGGGGGGGGSAVPGRILLDDPKFRSSSLDERFTNCSHNHNTHDMPVSHRNDPVISSLKDFQTHPSVPQQQICGSQPQQQQMVLQQLPRNQRKHNYSKEASPCHSMDTLYIDIHGSSNDKLNSPSPTHNKSPKILKKSPSPTFNFLRDSSRLSPSLPSAKSLRESRSVSPLAPSSINGCGKESPPSPFLPIKEFNSGSTPSPPQKSIKTQVAVEVHQQLQHNGDISCNSSINSDEFHQRLQIRLDRTRSCTGYVSPAKNAPLSRNKGLHNIIYSSSLETDNSTQRSSYSDSRKVKSYDDYREDYDVLKITEFSKGPFHSTDYDVMAELGSPTSSKVRYNDTGSLEQLHDEDIVSLGGVDYQTSDSNVVKAGDFGPGGSDSNSGTVNSNPKYHALWRLRATLEEEEECSDTIRMENMTSPDDSPDHEHTTPNTTSFESNALSDPCTSDHRDSGIHFEAAPKIPNQANLLHPNYENRRQSYRNIMNNRLQRGNQSTSVENSLDSVETDGDVSDTSRYEVTTTSFESTTDNTDSTTESQASRLKQMKADSGYKSLESKELHDSKGNGLSTDTRKEMIRASIDQNLDNTKNADLAETNTEPIIIACSSSQDRHGAAGNVGIVEPEYIRKSPPNTSHFDRRNGKTASKKRREYSRERQVLHVSESIHEPDTDSRSDLHSGDSFEENSIPNKTSLFTRFFKSHSRGYKTQYLIRDFSIDEKTNHIFNEFVRQEIPASSRDHTGHGRLGVRRSPRMHRHRFQRKHTEPALLSEERLAMRNRLAPGMRSASLGSDSSASSALRISPQDSIEEEEDEGEEIAAAALSSYSFDRNSSFGLQGHRCSSNTKYQLQSLAIHDIPIIKLPEEEYHDSHLPSKINH